MNYIYQQEVDLYSDRFTNFAETFLFQVPGQPYLGLLGILSEYYKYKEPNHKQGRVLGNALRYLYRVKKVSGVNRFGQTFLHGMSFKTFRN